MLHLYLVRHAKSSWEYHTLSDFDRPLSRRGLETAPEMAKKMKQLGIRPDKLVSSPANRAITTARFFAEAFEISDSEVEKVEKIYDATVPMLKDVVRNLPENAQTVFLFGHNPTFTDFSNLFTENEIENVPTCGIVHIISEAGKWSDFFEKKGQVLRTFFPKELGITK